MFQVFREGFTDYILKPGYSGTLVDTRFDLVSKKNNNVEVVAEKRNVSLVIFDLNGHEETCRSQVTWTATTRGLHGRASAAEGTWPKVLPKASEPLICEADILESSAANGDPAQSLRQNPLVSCPGENRVRAATQATL